MPIHDLTGYRERFLRDPLPIRLGGISASLARVKSFSAHDRCEKVVAVNLEDAEYLIEWTCSEILDDPEMVSELSSIQTQVALWRSDLTIIWMDTEMRSARAEQAGRISDRLLDMSGLLNEETYIKYNIPMR